MAKSETKTINKDFWLVSTGKVYNLVLKMTLVTLLLSASFSARPDVQKNVRELCVTSIQVNL